jgi:hypothetical protein
VTVDEIAAAAGASRRTEHITREHMRLGIERELNAICSDATKTRMVVTERSASVITQAGPAVARRQRGLAIPD